MTHMIKPLAGRFELPLHATGIWAHFNLGTYRTPVHETEYLGLAGVMHALNPQALSASWRDIDSRSRILIRVVDIVHAPGGCIIKTCG